MYYTGNLNDTNIFLPPTQLFSKKEYDTCPSSFFVLRLHKFYKICPNFQGFVDFKVGMKIKRVNVRVL